MPQPLSHKECSVTPLWFDTAVWTWANARAHLSGKLTSPKRQRGPRKRAVASDWEPSSIPRGMPDFLLTRTNVKSPCLSALERAGASRPLLHCRLLIHRAPGDSNSPFRTIRIAFEISMPCENRHHCEGRLQVSTATNRLRTLLAVVCQHKVAWTSQCWFSSNQCPGLTAVRESRPWGSLQCSGAA